MNVSDILTENTETPLEKIQRTKRFIENLSNCQKKYFYDCVRDLKLDQSKTYQLYCYLFENGHELYFE